MKPKLLLIICMIMLLAGCSKNINESTPNNASIDTTQTSDIINNYIEESTETITDGVFPPEGITAPTIAIPSEHQYETGEEIPAGYHPPDEFELDGVAYTEAVQHSSWTFVIEDDGNIVVEGEPEHEDNEVVKALREIYSLEYVGLSHLNEHLFRYGDGLLAIAKSPAEKIQSVYFKDYDYDESQFYYALIYEPYDN